MKRVLSTLLCIVMIFSCLVPTVAFADTVSTGTISESSEIIGTLEPIRNSEITSMRTKNSKTYQMSDGTYQCVVYSENVHYEDANGTLQEIDNTIKTTTAKSGYSLTNTANSWRTFFANKLSQDNAVIMEKDNYSISFSLLSDSGLIRPSLSSIGTPASDAKIAASMTATEIAENPIYSSLAADNRVVLYKDVANNVDISYTVRNGILKEDIILKSASAPNTFEFKMNTTGVTAHEINGTVVFKNSADETVFELAPMYMQDANGKYSEEISYDLIQDTEGYTLTLTVDSNFLLDSKTVYPVVVDPSVMVTGESDTYDTCVDQQYPTKNYYLSENLWTGGALNTNAMRTYIKYDLPTNISPAKVSRAYIRIKKKEHEVPTIKAYRVTSSWTSSSITWNNKPGYTTTNASRKTELDTGSWYRLEVTPFVRQWMKGVYSNYGVVLKEPSETSSTQKTKFYSSDAPSPNKPELVIEYLSSLPNARLVGVTNEGHDHSSCLTTAKGYLEDCDFTSVYKHTGSFTVANINSYLNTEANAMFMSRSHGVATTNSSGTVTSTLIVLDDNESYVAYRSSAMSESLNLSNIHVALFIACQTGKGGVGGKNLPTVAVDRGAQSAVGFRNNVTCSKANTWTVSFASYMKNGTSVGDACSNLASLSTYSGSGLETYIVCGDKKTTLTGGE